MDKFPPEILHRIFAQIGLQQRLVCLLVCRSWWRVLDGYSLFYDIDFYETWDKSMRLDYAHLMKFRDRFNRIINTLEQSPRHAAQIEEIYFGSHPNARKILKVFPNARVIKMESDFSSTYSGQLIDIIHSKSKVEFLSDIDKCDVASQLIYSNLGGRLRTLYLDLESSDTEETSVAHQLKNLPVLENLSLSFPRINLHTLEGIHKNIPSIQNFALEYMYLQPGNLPLDIIPATAITKFKFHHGRFTDPDSHIRLYEYMAKKYINATDINYEDYYILHHSGLPPKSIYLQGVLCFFRAIKPTIGKFALHGVPEDVDPFEALDIGDSRIQNWSFSFCENKMLFQNFLQSNQSKYVEEISIESSDINSIHFLKDVPNLTYLRIRYFMGGYSRFRMADCLAACPSSLKTLIIDTPNMTVDLFQGSLESVQNLEINIAKITSVLGDIISSCFPNLVNLKLTGLVKENVNITLKSSHLQNATFYTSNIRKNKSRKHGLCFESPQQDEILYYQFCETETVRVEYEDIKHLPMLSIKSLTKKKLKVDERIEILSY
jgi:hypothetical protein